VISDSPDSKHPLVSGGDGKPVSRHLDFSQIKSDSAKSAKQQQEAINRVALCVSELNLRTISGLSSVRLTGGTTLSSLVNTSWNDFCESMGRPGITRNNQFGIGQRVS